MRVGRSGHERNLDHAAPHVSRGCENDSRNRNGGCVDTVEKRGDGSGVDRRIMDYRLAARMCGHWFFVDDMRKIA